MFSSSMVNACRQEKGNSMNQSTKCPYCGKPVSYPTAFLLRRRGEYFCKKCKKESNVHINKMIWIAVLLTVLISFLVLMYFLFMTDRENLWYILVVMIPYIAFYLCSPLFVRLRPKRKFQDSLYDTGMGENPAADPDPTVAQSAKVVPAFVDDIVLEDDNYKPVIDSDIFNSIKEERRAIADTDGGTRSFDKFENISSASSLDHTVKVDSISDIPRVSEEAPAPSAMRHAAPEDDA